MSYIKTEEEIKILKDGGKILGHILETLAKMVKPGVSAKEIDDEAERLILKAGGLPSFKNYKSSKNDPPFPSTVCFSINEDLVHGIASKEKIIKKGDIVSIDIGMKYPANSSKPKANRGLYTDTSITVAVGRIPKETKQLLNVTKQALEIGIKHCVVGNTIADIGRAIQEYVEPFGYGIVRDLVGHGVGHAVHEDPRVPNFYDSSLESWKLEPGVVIAIEPMVTMGGYRIGVADDGWSISTADKSLCAHSEHTVVITCKKPMVVTRRPRE
ncbi:type I methionyl aminopeptidase [Patescibacteria group bacterium]|nr:type I methionyl aminopeptidase [Patescibacteria group bacterium]